MERRTYLGSLGAASVAGLSGLAGCLDELNVTGDEDEEEGEYGEYADQTILDAQTLPGDPSQYSHPVYGERFPSISVPDPLTGETISTEDFVGERAFMITFIFTSCPDGACPALLLRLRRVQADAAEQGYSDDISLLGLTFDPERDTPEVLEEYAHQQGADLEAGNWHFLRPETYEKAEELVNEEIGMRMQRIEDEDEIADAHEGHGEASPAETDDGNGGHDGHAEDGGHGEDDEHGEHDGGDDQDGHDDHDHGEYTFNHINLIVLVNEDGIVERAYPQALSEERGTSIEQIVEDARTVAQH
ncbi:electron transporter SCO1/SenC [Natrialba chahannaoensis JCM 10990]|uniref:Electron transporter SCO1/SenC n=1 Tax=Natrialba chahannaoensis JCM 10990 TaxID=1227492 RepID=M0AD28_9EURY|nr:SCO family protein [Natrialba chahannaoensis]ELY95253.1 electron transporter SCO1/SenC [Natrialba chahannaoensis JCM 10990]